MHSVLLIWTQATFKMHQEISRSFLRKDRGFLLLKTVQILMILWAMDGEKTLFTNF